ncbi:hypothetical protein [Streptomyces sp. NPDC058155]|uniref:hypothetical protein n=1 Tax=Streptomyces sp. NPDC058155 TaxID=3346359 RepID=UPI0036E1D26F
MKTCTSLRCGQDYDETDPEAVKYHTEPVNCSQSCRCAGRPACYTCHGSFCYCVQH